MPLPKKPTLEDVVTCCKCNKEFPYFGTEGGYSDELFPPTGFICYDCNTPEIEKIVKGDGSLN